MSKVIRFIDSTPDGTIELFEAPQEYIDGSLWITEVDTLGVVKSRDAIDIGNGFFQITPAPASGTKLFCTAEIGEVDQLVTDGLSPWEHANLNKLLETIKALKEAVDSMNLAMDNRVTKNTFNAWASIVEKQVKDLKATLLLAQ